jgi:hypothetical protein
MRLQQFELKPICGPEAEQRRGWERAGEIRNGVRDLMAQKV